MALVYEPRQWFRTKLMLTSCHLDFAVCVATESWSHVFNSFSSPSSAHSGVVLSVEEVEAGLKGLKVGQEGKTATPLMAEQMEEALNMTDSQQPKKDGDMSAFNKLVSTMKASGTLPSQPKVNVSKYLIVLNVIY